MSKKHVIGYAIVGVLVISGFSTVLINQNHTAVAEANVTKEQELPTQEEIQFKMLNAIDYYETVQSKVVHDYEDLNFDFIVESDIDLVQRTSHIQTKDIQGNQIIRQFETAFLPQTGEFLKIRHHTKTYTTLPAVGFTPEKNANLNQKRVTEKQLFLAKYPTVASRYTQTNGVLSVISRPDLVCMGEASIMTFPQAIALNYLRDPNLWKVESRENLLNRNAIVIFGTFKEGSIAPIRTATTFKLWVDEATGILLKYESYAPNGELRDRSTTEYIRIDMPSKSSQNPIQIPTVYQTTSMPNASVTNQ